jgi:hypothetical protein
MEQNFAGIQVLQEGEGHGGITWDWYYYNDGTMVFPNNTIDSYRDRSLSIKTHDHVNHTVGSSYTWTFGTDGSISLPDTAKINSGGVGTTNSAEFGTVIDRYGNGLIMHSEVYMGAGTTETRGIVDDAGRGLIYTGVENPGFAGMVAVDPGVTSQYAVSQMDDNIIIGATQPGGNITVSGYSAGLGVMNGEYNINGFYADGLQTVTSSGSEGGLRSTVNMGATVMYTLTQKGDTNAYVFSSQDTEVWQTYAADDISNSYAKIALYNQDITHPRVVIDTQDSTNATTSTWTFNSSGIRSGILSLPNGAAIGSTPVTGVNGFGIAQVYYYQYDSSALAITIAIGDTVRFPDFSGQILINDHSATGQLDMWLCGGAAAYLAASSKTGDPSYVNMGLLVSDSGINGYTWTSNINGDINFTAVRTRTGA